MIGKMSPTGKLPKGTLPAMLGVETTFDTRESVAYATDVHAAIAAMED